MDVLTGVFQILAMVIAVGGVAKIVTPTAFAATLHALGLPGGTLAARASGVVEVVIHKGEQRGVTAAGGGPRAVIVRAAGCVADGDGDVSAALGEGGDEPPADEACGAGDEGVGDRVHFV